jgi:hypothetical protein
MKKQSPNPIKKVNNTRSTIAKKNRKKTPWAIGMILGKNKDKNNAK